MEKPGTFLKCVNPNEIDFAYKLQTICIYKGKEFYVIDLLPNGAIHIVPYSKNLYSRDELLILGFEPLHDGLAKWLDPLTTEKIWTKTEKLFDFAKFENQDKILFEK